MARANQLVDRVGRQDDNVKGLASLHTPGSIHTANRLDGQASTRVTLKCIRQLGQDLARGHGGNAFDFGRHDSDCGLPDSLRQDGVVSIRYHDSA